MRSRITFYSTVMISALAAVLLVAALPAASKPLPQGDVTAQRQTIEAAVKARFQQTEVQAASATASFEAAVNDAMNEALTATAGASTASTAASSNYEATVTPTVAMATPISTVSAASPVSYVFDSVDVFDAPVLSGVSYLSPDGQHIAFTTGSQVCIYDAHGQKQTCADVHSMDRNSLRWSPDSKLLTFTEDFFRYLLNSDIHVMDAVSGRVTDLTDDQFIKFEIFKATPGVPVPNIDVAPTWYSDSQHLLFVRYTQALGTWIANLYTIPVSGGTPTLNTILPTPRWGTYALTLSPDNKLVAYNIDSAKQTDPQNGLSLITIDGQNAHQLVQEVPFASASASPFKPSMPAAIQFSADGRSLLIFDVRAMASVSIPIKIPTSGVVAVDGSPDSPVDADNDAQWATWSPTGNALAYIVRDVKNPENSGLYIADKPGAAGRLIYQDKDQPAPLYPPVGTWRTMDWAANDTILLSENQSGGRKFILVHLKAK